MKKFLQFSFSLIISLSISGFLFYHFFNYLDKPYHGNPMNAGGLRELLMLCTPIAIVVLFVIEFILSEKLFNYLFSKLIVEEYEYDDQPIAPSNLSQVHKNTRYVAPENTVSSRIDTTENQESYTFLKAPTVDDHHQRLNELDRKRDDEERENANRIFFGPKIGGDENGKTSFF